MENPSGFGTNRKPGFVGAKRKLRPAPGRPVLVHKQDKNGVNYSLNKKLLELADRRYVTPQARLVFVQLTHYPTFLKIYVPNAPLAKDIERRKTDSEQESTDQTEDDFERSIRRTKKTIRDLVLCNEFDLFCTFTFSPKKVDRQDIVKVKRKMNDWLKT